LIVFYILCGEQVLLRLCCNIFKFFLSSSGLGTPVRVCDNCAIMVDEEMRGDGLTWRIMRVEAYLSTTNKDKCNEKPDNKSQDAYDEEDDMEDCLIPYNDEYTDRGVDKVIRVAECSLQVVKSTVSLNYPTRLALDTIDILKRYGTHVFCSYVHH
jgi:hypothetical protein